MVVMDHDISVTRHGHVDVITIERPDVRNALRFQTKEEAEQYVADLASRWFAVRSTRVVESDEPVNYRINNHGRAEPVESVA